MDISALSTSMSQTQLMNNVSVALLSKQLDTLENAGDSMIRMMEQSVNPNLGSNIDVTV